MCKMKRYGKGDLKNEQLAGSATRIPHGDGMDAGPRGRGNWHNSTLLATLGERRSSSGRSYRIRPSMPDKDPRSKPFAKTFLIFLQ